MSEKPDQNIETTTAANDRCPKCGSPEWKSAAMVYAEGHLTGSSSTQGVGGGLSSDGAAVGIGRAQTNGTYQSALSKSAAPPTLQRTFGDMPESFVKPGFILTACAAVWIMIHEGAYPNSWEFWIVLLILTLLIVFLLACIAFILPFTPEQHEWLLKAKHDYEHTRVCSRCGEFYVHMD